MMDFVQDQENLYDLLEVAPSASQSEIRAAYLRVKSAFRKDNAALYSLMTEEDTDSILRKVEGAFQVLSNPDKRREYDEAHQITHNSNPFPPLRTSEFDTPTVISIDRVPPMDRGTSVADVLVPPSTDFTDPLHAPPASARLSPSAVGSLPNLSRFPSSAAVRAPVTSMIETAYGSAPQSSEVEQWIQNESEWAGAFIRKVREAKGVTIEEIAEYSKISRTYIHSIEEEIFEKLPAPVYLRGFLTQIAKFLKIPAEKLVAGYLVRYSQMRDAKRA